MPFVRTLPLMLAHLQPDADPVRAAAEAVEPMMEHRLYSAWDGLSARLHTLGRISAKDTLQRIAQELSEEVKPIAHDLLLARSMGYGAMSRRIAAETVAKDFTLSFHFDRLAPAVQEQADQYAARFVREIGEDTRTTLANMVRLGVVDGLGPEELARIMRDSVGLTTAQAQAVQNYRRLLETGSPEALDRALRDKRYDVPVERLAELTPDQIETRVAAYRRRYIAYRANTIARYETLYASNAGSVSAIQSGIKVGTLPKTTAKVWLIAKDENTCAKCRSIPEIQPNGVGIDQNFIWRTAGRHGHAEGEIFLAPLHPSCRCTNAYRIQ